MLPVPIIWEYKYEQLVHLQNACWQCDSITTESHINMQVEFKNIQVLYVLMI